MRLNRGVFMTTVLGGGATSSPLLLSVTAAWNLDNGWTDATGRGNTLVPAAGGAAPTFDTGKINQAALFANASSQYASVTDKADLSTGNIGFWFSMWFKHTTYNGSRGMFGKGSGGGSANLWEYFVYHNSLGKPVWLVSNGVATTISVAWGANIDNTNWHHMMGWHDPDNNLIGLCIDNGLPVTAAFSAGGWDSDKVFYLGAEVGASSFYDGMIDCFMFGKGYVPLTADIAALYNGGSAVQYPF